MVAPDYWYPLARGETFGGGKSELHRAAYSDNLGALRAFLPLLGGDGGTGGGLEPQRRVVPSSSCPELEGRRKRGDVKRGNLYAEQGQTIQVPARPSWPQTARLALEG